MGEHYSTWCGRWLLHQAWAPSRGLSDRNQCQGQSRQQDQLDSRLYWFHNSETTDTWVEHSSPQIIMKFWFFFKKLISLHCYPRISLDFRGTLEPTLNVCELLECSCRPNAPADQMLSVCLGSACQVSSQKLDVIYFTHLAIRNHVIGIKRRITWWICSIHFQDWLNPTNIQYNPFSFLLFLLKKIQRFIIINAES